MRGAFSLSVFYCGLYAATWRSAAGFDSFSEFADSPVLRSMGELVAHGK